MTRPRRGGGGRGGEQSLDLPLSSLTPYHWATADVGRRAISFVPPPSRLFAGVPISLPGETAPCPFPQSPTPYLLGRAVGVTGQRRRLLPQNRRGDFFPASLAMFTLPHREHGDRRWRTDPFCVSFMETY